MKKGTRCVLFPHINNIAQSKAIELFGGNSGGKL
jgi:hypothetical protein